MTVFKSAKTLADRDSGLPTPTVSLTELNRRLGRKAAAELIRRTDPALRKGQKLATRRAFEARTLLGRLPEGRIQFVIPEDASKKNGEISASDVFIILDIADLEAIVRAGGANVTELRAFAPCPLTPPLGPVPKARGTRKACD